ncbi:hypothetical protein BDF22DRAFT_728864 [Syncephalis plumigaleata]|nr:hypothetical protein BDF22DRAFT_728864 [Syncephalis plumigaleata]
MPTVNVDKEELFKALGRSYTTEEFRDLCFEFGIELDEDTSEKEMATREKGAEKAEGLSDRPILKIDISANRYDLLCLEGIAKALLIFQEKMKPPQYHLSDPPAGQSVEKLYVAPEVAQVRPIVVAAILRNVTLDDFRYNSFIDLQEKLHQNICRKRTLVSIGTHDLDKIKGPFYYRAQPPKDIKFIPLNQTVSLDGPALMSFYENDRHLGKYLPIIRDSPVYPVVYDADNTVLSLPPIINGDHSKITTETKNIFIECTATDVTKARVVLNTIITAFSEYCTDQWSVEPVDVVYPDGRTLRYPDLSEHTIDASVDYINGCVGVQLTSTQIVNYLQRMGLGATASSDERVITASIPPTRSDILHACDIMEDVAIAYGYNKIKRIFPNTNTIAAPLPINKLSDQIRREFALAGWTEVLPLILCSHDENYAFLNQVDDGSVAIKLANPKTVEYQVVRSLLLPGLLKTIHSNRKHPLPLRIFEVSDVGLKDEREERRARNERHVCAVYSNKTSGFEIIHGALNRMMRMLDVPLVNATSKEPGYFIAEYENATYFPGRSANIYLRDREQSVKTIGTLGVLHPKVLQNFEINYPCSALEFNLEPFL